MRTKFYFKQNGFAIIHVLIVSALIGVMATVSIIIASMLNNQDKVLGHKQNLEGFSSLVSTIMTDPKLCVTDHFPSPNYPPLAADQHGIWPTTAWSAAWVASAGTTSGVELELRLPQYKIGVNPQQFISSASAANRTVSDLNLIIQSVRFTNARPLTISPTPPIPVDVYEGDLEIVASPISGSSIGSIRKTVGKIRLEFDQATKNYKGCAGGITPGDVCASLGGRYDNTITPACRFGLKDVTNCPPGQIITSLSTDAAGNVSAVCTPADLDCPAGQYLLEITGNTIRCVTGTPPPPPCTPTARVWVNNLEDWRTCQDYTATYTDNCGNTATVPGTMICPDRMTLYRDGNQTCNPAGTNFVMDFPTGGSRTWGSDRAFCGNPVPPTWDVDSVLIQWTDGSSNCYNYENPPGGGSVDDPVDRSCVRAFTCMIAGWDDGALFGHNVPDGVLNSSHFISGCFGFTRKNPNHYGP